MPIPKPTEKEARADFISRCMGNDMINAEYPDTEKRAAVCNAQWKAGGSEGVRGGDRGGNRDRPLVTDNKSMKLETLNVLDVEVFAAGFWNGDEYTERDLDEIVQHYNDGLLEPYLNINHSKKASKQFGDALKSLSLGFVSRLERAGKKLIADFKQVPKTIAELIEAGALKKKSIEIFRRYPHADGKVYRNILQAVTFHGADGVPAVNTLSDFVKLYKADLPTIVLTSGEIVMLDEFKTTGVKKMSDIIELKKADYDELKESANKVDGMAGEIATLKTEAVAQTEKLTAETEKVTKLEAEKVISDKFKADTEKVTADELKKVSETYVDDQVKAGKVRAVDRDDYVADFKRCSDESIERLARFKADIESRNQYINMTGTKDENSDTIAKEFKTTDALEDAIQIEMKKSSVKWEVARKTVLGIEE